MKSPRAFPLNAETFLKTPAASETIPQRSGNPFQGIRNQGKNRAVDEPESCGRWG